MSDNSAHRLADEILKLAAWRSTQTPFGWAHPDCEALEEAARILKGEPLLEPDRIVDGVLSFNEIVLPVSNTPDGEKAPK